MGGVNQKTTIIAPRIDAAVFHLLCMRKPDTTALMIGEGMKRMPEEDILPGGRIQEMRTPKNVAVAPKKGPRTYPNTVAIEASICIFMSAIPGAGIPGRKENR